MRESERMCVCERERETDIKKQSQSLSLSSCMITQSTVSTML